MPVQQPETTGFLFDHLPVLLRQRGFVVGVEEYLRMQELLDRTGLSSILWDDSRSPRLQEIRSFLCPLFAKSKEQQRIFYDVFDGYYAALNTQEPAAKKQEQKAMEELSGAKLPLLARRWPYLLAVTLLLAALSSYVLLPLFKAIPAPPVPPPPPSAPWGELVSPEPPVEVAAKLVHEPSPLGREPKPPWYDPFTHSWSVLSLLAPLLFFLAHQLYRPVQRALLQRGTRKPAPPYSWPLQVKAPLLRYLESELFYIAARNLRRRELGKVLKLDLRSSVMSTLRAGGYPTLRYKPLTRRPEYLILVQCTSAQDQLWQLYNQLQTAFEHEAVHLRSYFFQTDPRVVTEAASNRILRLTELEKRFADHRLLVFGEAGCLLHPVTGRLAEWVELLEAWPSRALLSWKEPTPRQVDQIAGRGGFALLPAVLSGFEQVPEHLEFSRRPRKVTWPLECGHLPALREPAEDMARLRGWLGPNGFQWLCACAVYPELQWQLTLHLGSLAAMPANLLTENNLVRLLRLDWFRQGSIPDRWRQALISALEPSIAEGVKEALVELLERSPAKPGTYAELARQLQVAVYHSKRNPLQRKRLRPQLERLLTWPAGKIVEDYALLRSLETRSPRLRAPTFVGRMLERLYADGIRSFGWSGVARAGAVLMMTCGVAAALVFIHSPHPREEPPVALGTLALEIVDSKNQGINDQVSVELTQSNGRRYQNDVQVNRELYLTGIQVSDQATFRALVRSGNASAEIPDLTVAANQTTQRRVELPILRSAPTPAPTLSQAAAVAAGVVVDARTKDPISGAEVTLGAGTLDSPRAIVVVTTGKKGDFQFSTARIRVSGPWLRINKDGYQAQTLSIKSVREIPSLIALQPVGTTAGRRAVLVPDLVGVSLDKALLFLKETQLSAQVTRKEYRDAAADTVIAQTPQAGTRVDRGASVLLVIAASARDSATGSVAEASLSVQPSQIERGQAAELRWSLPPPYRASIEPGIGVVTESGSRRVYPEVTTTYTMTISRPLGVIERKATISVVRLSDLNSPQRQTQPERQVPQQQRQQLPAPNAPPEQAKIYVDRSTGLTWTKGDNGKDVNSTQAVQYCESLTLTGNSDWRLPTIAELKRFDDPYIRNPFTLTGPWVWSSTKEGGNSVLLFSFHRSERSLSSRSLGSDLGRALCARGPARSREMQK